MKAHAQQNIVMLLWGSFHGLPLWVRLWMVLGLIPINAASLIFIYEPMGPWVAALANLGMLCNVPIMIKERRISRTMALPHLPFWTPLVALIIWTSPDISTPYGKYLIALATANVFSLLFDYVDAYLWLKGDRD